MKVDVVPYDPVWPEVYEATLQSVSRLARANAQDRDLYARTKLRLAGRDWERLQDYADAESEIVGEIMSRVCRARA